MTERKKPPANDCLFSLAGRSNYSRPDDSSSAAAPAASAVARNISIAETPFVSNVRPH